LVLAKALEENVHDAFFHGVVDESSTICLAYLDDLHETHGVLGTVDDLKRFSVGTLSHEGTLGVYT
jgi:hypothetical protein